MSTYQQLKGLKVKYLAADTSGDRAKEGEVFYNSSSFKIASHIAVNAWSSATPMVSAKKAAMPGGIQTAAFTAGGNDGSTNVNSTFEYDGSGFSSGGNINTTRRGGGGAGSLTAGLIMGGYTSTVVGTTEEYNGTSWSSANSMGTGRSGTGTNGTAQRGGGGGSGAGPANEGGGAGTAGGNGGSGIVILKLRTD